MNTQTELKSRWGYHPCDRELFLKLKFLHKWYWQTLYDFHRWHRWWRKTVHRVGPEPRYCGVFVADQPWYKPVQVHGVAGYKIYPRTVRDCGVVDWFQAVRIPQAEPVAPFDTATVQEIEKLYREVQEYVAK